METSISFVKTRHVYDSYRDFWSLVGLAGFDTIYVDELDVSQHGVYIVCPMNGEWRPTIDNQDDRPRNAHLVLWCLERPSGAGGVGNYAMANRDLIYKRHVDEVWVSDRRLADETTSRFVVLGSHPGLGQPGGEKKFDFCHMSYEVARRTNVYKHFPNSSIGPNCWPPERDEVLKASKFALNIHQDQYPFQEPLRFALFAAYGLPILTETIYDSYPWSDEFMAYNEYDGIVGRLRQMLENDYGRWREMGLKARERMCVEFEFGKVVRRAVAESVERWR